MSTNPAACGQPEIREVLSGLIAQLIEQDLSVVLRSSNLLELPGFSSVTLVQLIADIEDRFSVELTDADLEDDDFFNFEGLTGVVARRLAERNGDPSVKAAGQRDG